MKNKPTTATPPRGRPALPPALRRVPLSVRITPSTRLYLEAMASRLGISMGEAIDRLTNPPQKVR